MTKAALMILPALLALSPFAYGKGGSHFGGYNSHGHPHAVPNVPRDSHGKIARSSTARREFMQSHPCPSTGRSSGACPGFVVDHVVPLKRGGADAPANMQWQTIGDAKAKDRTE
jgi:hypothetical protein